MSDGAVASGRLHSMIIVRRKVDMAQASYGRSLVTKIFKTKILK